MNDIFFYFYDPKIIFDNRELLKRRVIFVNYNLEMI